MRVLCAAFDEFPNIILNGTKHVIHSSSLLGDNTKVVEEEGNYEVHPAEYVSAPQLSYYAMLNQTKSKLELMTVPEISDVGKFDMWSYLYDQRARLD